jgi:hypothetical protein
MVESDAYWWGYYVGGLLMWIIQFVQLWLLFRLRKQLKKANWRLMILLKDKEKNKEVVKK